MHNNYNYLHTIKEVNHMLSMAYRACCAYGLSCLLCLWPIVLVVLMAYRAYGLLFLLCLWSIVLMAYCAYGLLFLWPIVLIVLMAYCAYGLLCLLCLRYGIRYEV